MSRSIDVDTKTFLRFWLVMAALAIIALFVMRAKTGLIIVGLAIFFAIAIKPLANKIDSIDKRKKRQGLSAGLAVGGVVLLIGLILGTVGPVIINETSRFVAQAPEQIQSSIGGWDGINTIGRSFGIDDAQTQIMSMLKDFSSSFVTNFSSAIVSSVSTIANVITAAVLVIVLTILFLTQGPALLGRLWGRLLLRDDGSAVVVKRISEKIAGVISGYMTRQVFVAVLDGVVAGVAVFILSLLFGFSSGLAFPMAMIAMIFYLIPMFGPIISCVLISLMLFFSSPVAAAVFLVFYIVYEQIENNVISPKIQGNSMNLPSLVILVAITIGMYMFGLLGAIISIPIAGCIKVLIDEYPNLKKLHE